MEVKLVAIESNFFKESSWPPFHFSRTLPLSSFKKKIYFMFILSDP